MFVVFTFIWTFQILLYPANYISGKGHRECLSAFSIAYQANKNIRLRFVGSDMGLAKSRELRHALEIEVERNGLSNVVKVEDFCAEKELMYKNADVVLNFSISESFSRTCFEASFYGVPVIATRCGGPEEIIENDVTGILVDLGDLDKMKEAILRLADDRQLRRSMGTAAAVHVRRRFVENWEHSKGLLVAM